MTGLPYSNRPSWIERATAPLRQLPPWIALAVEGWRERFALERDMAQLRMQGELERTLADSGISPSELPRLVRAHPGAARQFAEMVDRVGIDRARLPVTLATGAALRDMGLRCGECGSWRRCRAWLAAGLRTDGYRGFCPNAEALELLRDQQRTVPSEPADGPSSARSGILDELRATAGQRL